MRFEPQEHLDPQQERRREPGLGAPAGVFLLDGAYHVAGFASAAADRLHARGALLIAALRFDGPARDSSRAAAAPLLRELKAPRDLPSLGGASGEN
jgi:hypothetical protein